MLEPPETMILRDVGVKLSFGRKGQKLTSLPGISVRNRRINACTNFRREQRNLPKTQRLLGEMDAMHQCQKLRSRSSGIRTLSSLNISAVRQVSLHADYNIIESREDEGGQEIVADALLEQDRRVGSELGICGKRRGEGEGIILACRMRDDISCPSQSQRHEG